MRGRLLAVALVLSLALTGLAAGSASAHTVAFLHHKRMTAFRLFRTAQEDARSASDGRHAVASKKRAQHWLVRYRYWRNEEVWTRAYVRLPASTKAMLARLRGCETRGIPFPKNYQYKGPHRGAYQYLYSTWGRAGGHGDPADATPHEQDVRTARFYPSHRGEWACSA